MLPSMDVQSARGNAMEIREFDLKPIFLVTFGSDQSLQHRKRRVISLELWQFGRRKLCFYEDSLKPTICWGWGRDLNDFGLVQMMSSNSQIVGLADKKGGTKIQRALRMFQISKTGGQRANYRKNAHATLDNSQKSRGQQLPS